MAIDYIWDKTKKMPVWFNDIDLSPYLNVLSLERGVGNSRSNTLLKAGNQKGKQFGGYTYDEKSITMEFSMVHSLVDKRRELAGLLNVNKPVKLVFGDEPDKYYLAVPGGDISLSEDSGIAKGKINWIIPDGLAHAVKQKTFKAEKGKNEVFVDNLGTEITKPILSATMHSKNGLIAFIDKNGNVIQVGNPDAPDQVPKNLSENLFHSNFITNNGWTLNNPLFKPQYSKSATNIPSLVNGSILYGQGPGKEAATPVYVPNKTASWAGPMISRKMTANMNGTNSGSFYFTGRFNNKIDRAVNDLSRLEYNFYDKANNIVLSASIRDEWSTKKQRNFQVYYKGKMIVDKILPEMASDFLSLEITKKDSVVTFVVGEIYKIEGLVLGKHYSEAFLLPDFDKTNVNNIGIWMSKFKDEPQIGLDITDATFTWINVVVWDNIPNIFNNGDTLFLDTSNGEIYLNGRYRPDLETFGNNWDGFQINPNVKHESMFTVESNWCTQKPDYEIVLREEWL